MIELDGNCWVYGIWFVPGGDKDWMACLRKVDEEWRLDYRFRYYRDHKAHDSEDEKSWYSAKMTGSVPLATVVAGIESGITAAIETQIGGNVEFLRLECQGDDPKVFFEISNCHWANPKMEAQCNR